MGVHSSLSFPVCAAGRRACSRRCRSRARSIAMGASIWWGASMNCRKIRGESRRRARHPVASRTVAPDRYVRCPSPNVSKCRGWDFSNSISRYRRGGAHRRPFRAYRKDLAVEPDGAAELGEGEAFPIDRVVGVLRRHGEGPGVLLHRHDLAGRRLRGVSFRKMRLDGTTGRPSWPMPAETAGLLTSLILCNILAEGNRILLKLIRSVGARRMARNAAPLLACGSAPPPRVQPVCG